MTQTLERDVAPPQHQEPPSLQVEPALLHQDVVVDIDATLTYSLAGPCDFIFLLHVTANEAQQIISESVTLQPPTPYRLYTDDRSGNRFMRLRAQPGPFSVRYQAAVQRAAEPDATGLAEVAVHDLPDDVLHHLMPTRYCESDELGTAAQKLFQNGAPGFARVQAVTEWVHANIDYRPGSSDATTTAKDVFVQRAGVCRDFAHLAVTFCRALNIPARLVCGYAKFSEPPPDFHAVFEAFLGGRWVMFDPTGMSPVERLVRVGTGRDAKDVAFATIFGPACMTSLHPEVSWRAATPLAHIFDPTAAVDAT